MNSPNVERLISLLPLLKAHGIDTDALKFSEAVDFLIEVDNTIKRVNAEKAAEKVKAETECDNPHCVDGSVGIIYGEEMLCGVCGGSGILSDGC